MAKSRSDALVALGLVPMAQPNCPQLSQILSPTLLRKPSAGTHTSCEGENPSESLDLRSARERDPLPCPARRAKVYNFDHLSHTVSLQNPNHGGKGAGLLSKKSVTSVPEQAQVHVEPEPPLFPPENIVVVLQLSH
jgi:hypothetical protein